MRKAKVAEETPEASEGGKPFTKGGKGGPGRPKGAMSKRTIGDILRVQEVMDAKDYDPIAALIEEAANETDAEKRRAIHYSLMPFVYQRLPALPSAKAEGEEEDDGGGKGFRLSLVL